MIKFGNRPSPIPNNTITSLKLMIEGGYNPQPTDYFIKGDPVIIKDGPLKGLREKLKLYIAKNISLSILMLYSILFQLR